MYAPRVSSTAGLKAIRYVARMKAIVVPNEAAEKCRWS